jgi:DNA polymerase delta subunit 2
LSSFIDTLDVDVMPGDQDFASAYMPQQPVNSFMFPKLAEKECLNLVTNPHRFTAFQGLDFMGTSGQNLNNMRLFSEFEDASGLNLLHMSLEMRHMCPNAPDTLRTFPFRTEDPFVIDRAPDVYFTGCQSSYGEKLVQ